eukprot:3024012-Lingulodinium_polyedra.AAC.1
MSSAQRNAQLAADVHEVQCTVGMSDIDARYPQILNCVRVADSAGGKARTQAMLLFPTHDSAGLNMSTLS